MMKATANDNNFQDWITCSSKTKINIDKVIYKACKLVFVRKYNISVTEDEEEEKKEEEEKEKPFDMSQVIKLMCPSMHKVVAYKGGFKRINSKAQYPGSRSTTVIDRGTTVMTCTSCKQEFDSKEKRGYCSCLQACDYILCPRCSRCERCLKPLEIYFRKPPKYIRGNDRGEGPWFMCSYCRTNHGYSGNSVENSAFLRCDKCDTDICRNCIEVCRDAKNPKRFYPQQKKEDGEGDISGKLTNEL